MENDERAQAREEIEQRLQIVTGFPRAVLGSLAVLHRGPPQTIANLTSALRAAHVANEGENVVSYDFQSVQAALLHLKHLGLVTEGMDVRGMRTYELPGLVYSVFTNL